MAESRTKKHASAVEGEEQDVQETFADTTDEEPVVVPVDEPVDAPAAEPPRTYSAARLIEDAQDFLGVPSHVAVGAFFGQKDDNWTIDEAASRVNAWLKTEV